MYFFSLEKLLKNLAFSLETHTIKLFIARGMIMEFEFSKMLEEVLTWIVAHFDGPLWDATIIILLGTGLFFTITTGFVQFRLFPASLVKCGLVVLWREVR